ncbi:MAG: DUF2892 domain-containing protein [Armatimonadetes bacterium]|nr:DUF2892 domain-containing protein [Armatimonadota bacterium]MDE2207433.1 DUF2892 domain-containing protein [Armatimonadota bacterium]
MYVERSLRLIAGVAVTATVLAALLVNRWWLVVTLLVGINLLQSGFTDWCPMKWLLERRRKLA